MDECKKVKQKELVQKINAIKKRRREYFIKEIVHCLEDARNIFEINKDNIQKK